MSTQARSALEATAAADSARNRGQSAWAISSGVAGALIAGGVLTNGSERPWWAQLAGLLAIIAWIATAILFISAVSGIDPIRMKRRTRPATGVMSVEQAFEQAQADRHAIDRQLNLAYFATVAAIVLTSAALVAGLVSSVAPAHIKAFITLKGPSLPNVQKICPAVGTKPLPGSIERGSLTRPFAVIVLKKGTCDINDSEDVELQVPPSDIAAFRSR